MFLSAFIRFGNTAKLERFFDDVKRFSSVMFTFSTLTFERFFGSCNPLIYNGFVTCCLLWRSVCAFLFFGARKALGKRSEGARCLCAFCAQGSEVFQLVDEAVYQFIHTVPVFLEISGGHSFIVIRRISLDIVLT